MNIFDLITQEEIDDLPEDPAMAFLAFVRHAQNRLSERTKDLNSSQDDDWHSLQDARYGFQNVVIAAGKRFGIEPFASLSVPRREQYERNDNYQQFKFDLDHYMTQLLLDNSIRGKKDTVFIDPIVKEKIRKYISALKNIIDRGSFSDSKRANLLNKLSEFERELDKGRVNLMAVAGVAFVILGVPGSLWASYDVVKKLTTNIIEAVAEAKVADDENRRLPLIEKPLALTPPRNEEPPPEKKLDDEIPF